jgi:hypothetical protein
MTAADLRAIAARVMAGEDVPAHKITHAMGQTTVSQCLHSLDAADMLMRPFGFNVAVTIEQYPNANWIARAYLLHANGDCERVEASAPTEPRARTALALLCRAVELEHADG